MNDNKRVAIYVRVSTTEQVEEGYSIRAQENTLTDYCRFYNYKIVKVYKDEGISAKEYTKRTGLLNLIQDSKSGLFDIVLVWRLNRLTRNTTDLLNICSQLEENGVVFVSMTEAFDSNTPAGRLLRSMLGSIAQFERESAIENIILGLSERASQGLETSGFVLGYRVNEYGELEIVEEEAEYVRFVFKTYLIYKNFSKVARLCAEKGYLGKRGKPPKSASIMEILTHAVYCGYNPYKGKLYKGSHEAIIDVATFNKVQLIIMNNNVGRHRKKKLLLVA